MKSEQNRAAGLRRAGRNNSDSFGAASRVLRLRREVSSGRYPHTSAVSEVVRVLARDFGVAARDTIDFARVLLDGPRREKRDDRTDAGLRFE